jgi:hypothetical protein
MYISETTITKEDFNNYIADNADKKIKEFVKKCDDEDYLECKRVSFEGREKWLYDELWFIDINDKDGGYAPVIIQNINTSSAYAMWTSCLYDRDDDEEDEEEEAQSLEEVNFDTILNLVSNGYKKSLENLLNTYYKKSLN